MNILTRLKIIHVIVKRELKNTIFSLSFYIIVSLGLLASTFILKNYVQNIYSEGILISANPLNFPLYLAVFIGAFYLALSSSITISREREEGTLKTLFFGPVDSLNYLIANYLHQMLSLILIIGIFTFYFMISSMLVNFIFSLNFVKLIIIFVFSGSCIIAFGMFLSTLTTKAKTSIILFIVVIALFFSFQLLDDYILEIGTENSLNIISYLKKTFTGISNAVKWISPFSYINRGYEAVETGNIQKYFYNMIYSLIYNIIFVLLSNYSFRYKGVLRG